MGVGFYALVDALNARFAAESTARGSVEVTLCFLDALVSSGRAWSKVSEYDVVGIGSIWVFAGADAREIVAHLNDPFCEEKAGSQRSILTRCSHQHGDRSAVDANLHGLLDDDQIIACFKLSITPDRDSS